MLFSRCSVFRSASQCSMCALHYYYEIVVCYFIFDFDAVWNDGDWSRLLGNLEIKTASDVRYTNKMSKKRKWMPVLNWSAISDSIKLEFAPERKARHQTKWPTNNRPLLSGMQSEFLDNESLLNDNNNNNNDRTEEENNHHSLWNRFLFSVECCVLSSITCLSWCSMFANLHPSRCWHLKHVCYTFYCSSTIFKSNCVLFPSNSKHITAKCRLSVPHLILLFRWRMAIQCFEITIFPVFV